MAVQPVPLAILGAKHEAEVFRGALAASSQQAQGISLPGHLKVSATGTPSGQVSVAAGSALIKNLQKPGESYYGLNDDTPELVNVDPQLSGTRYDLIVMRIIDPQFAPWQPSGTPGAPNVSVPNGPYCQIVPIKGVSASTTRADQVVGYSAIALARVKMTNTSVATDITDLRKLAQPRMWPDYEVQSGVPAGDGSGVPLTTSDTGWTNWPLNTAGFVKPDWATHAQTRITINNMHVSGPADFNSRVWVGGLTDATKISMFDYNGAPGLPVGTVEHLTHTTHGLVDVRSLPANEAVTIRLQAMRTFTSNTGYVAVGSWEQVEFSVNWLERIV